MTQRISHGSPFPATPGAGHLGRHRSFGRPTGVRVPAAEVPAAVERLLRAYLTDRSPGENFREFCARHTSEGLAAFLVGGEARPPEVAATAESPAEPILTGEPV